MYPVSIKWFEWGYSGSRMVKRWYEGIALAATEKTLLVWRPMGSFDGHPRFEEILKERVKGMEHLAQSKEKKRKR